MAKKAESKRPAVSRELTDPEGKHRSHEPGAYRRTQSGKLEKVSGTKPATLFDEAQQPDQDSTKKGEEAESSESGDHPGSDGDANDLVEVMGAIQALDQNDESLWTQTGAPKVSALSKQLGRPVDEKTRDAAVAALNNQEN